MYDNTNLSDVADPNWKMTQDLYNRLAEADKNVFISLIKQTAIDTVSGIFGILDGVSGQELFGDDIRLLQGENMLSGDLQDFLMERYGD